MTDRPVIFSTPMVMALLKGRKTMTRRLAPSRVQIGDKLWVRESLQKFNRTPPTAQYVATITGVVARAGVPRHPNGAALWPSHWRRDKIPSIHMPRWASRMTLHVTDIRTEQLQDITDADACREGVGSADEFKVLWGTLHGEQAWRDNPIVAVIGFRLDKSHIDSQEAAA